MNIHVDIFVYIYTFVFGGQSELNKRLTLCVCARARMQHMYLLLLVCSWRGGEGAIRCLCSLPLCLETRSLTELIDWPGWIANEHEVSAYCTPGSASARITGTSQSGFLYRFRGFELGSLCLHDRYFILSTKQFSQPPHV